MKFPTPTGHVEIDETSGRCVMGDPQPDNTLKPCGMKGGGLIGIREIVEMEHFAAHPPAWNGRRVVLCGKHFAYVYGSLLRDANDAA